VPYSVVSSVTQLKEISVFLPYIHRSNGPARRMTPEVEAALRGTTLAERLTYSTPVPQAAATRAR
jgi:hypothetical protein